MKHEPQPQRAGIKYAAVGIDDPDAVLTRDDNGDLSIELAEDPLGGGDGDDGGGGGGGGGGVMDGVVGGVAGLTLRPGTGMGGGYPPRPMTSSRLSGNVSRPGSVASSNGSGGSGGWGGGGGDGGAGGRDNKILPATSSNAF